MMKHRKSILIALAAGALLLTGCENDCKKSEPVHVNVSEGSELSSNTFGVGNLIEIGNYLYYDSATRIVYFWNGHVQLDYSTTPTPYYAPNGNPYRYNPETNTFEQIE